MLTLSLFFWDSIKNRSMYTILFLSFHTHLTLLFVSEKESRSIGPIDNSHLLMGKKKELRRSLQEGRDFSFVPESVWKLLCRWYGGGPPIRRHAVAVGRENKISIELYPLSLHVCVTDHSLRMCIVTHTDWQVSAHRLAPPAPAHKTFTLSLSKFE